MNQVLPNTTQEEQQQYKDHIKMNYFEMMVERAKLKFKSKKEKKSPPTPPSSDAVIIVNVCFAYFSKLLKLMKSNK